MRGLIPDEINRLKNVNVFTPNLHHQWEVEENERALIEWARKETKPSLIPDTNVYSKRPIREVLKDLMPLP